MSSAYEVFDVHLNCIYHEDKLNRKFNAECDAYLHEPLPLACHISRVQWLCLIRLPRSTEPMLKVTLYISFFAPLLKPRTSFYVEYTC